MKKVAVIVLLSVFVMSMLAACGGDGPTDTAKDFMKAYDDLNVDKLKDLSCESPDEDFEDAIGDMEVEFNDLKFEEKNKKDDTADIQVKGKMKLKMGDEEMESDLDITLMLKKESGDWCVDDISGF
ncbi:MAG: hypothetical protein JXJ20_00180 [Anaerolineae bacterium]|jgi:hypothetical protein|nr:hypothetical protein [Anaerolineae bacterium]